MQWIATPCRLTASSRRLWQPPSPVCEPMKLVISRYKYDHVFTVEPGNKAQATIDWVHDILKKERALVIQSRALEATSFRVENIRVVYVFYESGLSINVMYDIDDPKRRAVGFQLSAGTDVPTELASRFKFATQKSKLAGTIRGSYFVIKGKYY
jgi:hypothetical protein